MSERNGMVGKGSTRWKNWRDWMDGRTLGRMLDALAQLDGYQKKDVSVDITRWRVQNGLADAQLFS